MTKDNLVNNILKAISYILILLILFAGISLVGSVIYYYKTILPSFQENFWLYGFNLGLGLAVLDKALEIFSMAKKMLKEIREVDEE